jgi:hypothetical protein
VRAIPRRWKAAAIAAGVVVVVGTGYGYSAITATNNTYTGCLQNGDLTAIAIGSTPLKNCPKTATQISWSQTGPQGLAGQDGTDGADGADGVSVTSATEPAGANCADGGSKFTAANDNVTYACNGAKGDQGSPGQKGEDGQDGTDGASLVGSPCSLPDNTPGTVQMSVAADGAISFVCQTAGGGTDLCADDLPAYPNATTHCDPETGTLSITCSTGFANGDNVITNGCEVNVLNDPANCGAVGQVVLLPHATGGCVGGQPVIASCQGENYDVDGVTGNGCERPQLFQAHTQSTAASVRSRATTHQAAQSPAGSTRTPESMRTQPSRTSTALRGRHPRGTEYPPRAACSASMTTR